MEDLCNIIKSVNNNMENFGFNHKLLICNDNCEITEEEVIIKMPYELKIKIPKDSFGKECSIKEAVSKAISQAVSSPVSLGK